LQAAAASRRSNLVCIFKEIASSHNTLTCPALLSGVAMTHLIVAVVDEMADTGETLALMAERVKQCGARRVITASLVAHSWADPMPDVVALTTDALALFPWDQQVYIDGQWRPHPELIEALKQQSDIDH
jgi:hypoxanthine phosphoribosyltransferase